MQGCPKCLASWHFYADAVKQLQTDFPNKYEFMYAEAREFPWLKKIYSIGKVPAFMVIQNSEIYYKEELTSFGSEKEAYDWMVNKTAKCPIV